MRLGTGACAKTTFPSPKSPVPSPQPLMHALPPLRFNPILREYLWGGRRLGTELGKPIGDGPHYAESWEVVDHGADQSTVADGPLAGKTLHELVTQQGAAIFGRHHPRDAVSAAAEIPRLPANSFRASPSQRRAGGKTRSARLGKNRSLGRAGRRTGKQDLRRPETRRRSANARARADARQLRSVSPRVRAARGRLRADRSRHRPRTRRRPLDRRNPASQRHHLSAVRLEPRRPRRQTAPAAHPASARCDRLRPRPGEPRHANADRASTTSNAWFNATNSSSTACGLAHLTHCPTTTASTSSPSSKEPFQ